MAYLAKLTQMISPSDYKLIIGDIILILVWIFIKSYFTSKDEIIIDGIKFNPLSSQHQINKLHKKLINNKL